MRVATIIGTRPQFIKCASLSKELRKHHDEVLINTGQHYDYNLSDIFIDELGMPRPDYDLSIRSSNQGRQTAEMLSAVEDILIEEGPDLVLVYGDTNSTLAGALAASKLHIRIGHVEAGLRSFDRRMPEEINRILTDHASDLLFAPTVGASHNLSNEGITEGVHVVGDVMVDSVLSNLDLARERSDILVQLNLGHKDYVLATVHRRGNTEDPGKLLNIINALGDSNRLVIFPIHPGTRKVLMSIGVWGKMPSNIRAIEPMGYLDMLMLLSSADKVVTDSGGVQKEAYIMRVPCITVRENTEWMETVDDGWNVLVGTDKEKITREILEFTPKAPRKSPFGNGGACKNILDVLNCGRPEPEGRKVVTVGSR